MTTELEKPIIDAIEATNLKATSKPIEHSTRTDRGTLTHPGTVYIEFNVNGEIIKARSIFPRTVEREVDRTKLFYLELGVKSKETLFPIVFVDNKTYLYSTDFVTQYEFTDDLKQVFEGRIDLLKASQETLRNYYDLVKNVNGALQTNYIYIISQLMAAPKYEEEDPISDNEEEPEERELKPFLDPEGNPRPPFRTEPPVYTVAGQGLHEGEAVQFLSDNPCQLFYELRKLLAAKKAGHSGTYNLMNAILKRLLEKKLITEKQYRKFLSKK